MARPNPWRIDQVNLSGFFQTAAMLSPILLAGTALTFTAKAAPKTGVGSAVRGLLVVGPRPPHKASSGRPN